MAVVVRFDHWVGQRKESGDLRDASPSEALEALKRLDGWNRTQLTLVADDGRMLMVGGGPDRFFVQYLLPEDAGEWLLIGDDADQGETELAIGRQRAPYPSRNLVDQEAAAAAIRTFTADGSLHPGSRWEQSY